jgi:hypothetical protein
MPEQIRVRTDQIIENSNIDKLLTTLKNDPNINYIETFEIFTDGNQKLKSYLKVTPLGYNNLSSVSYSIDVKTEVYKNYMINSSSVWLKQNFFLFGYSTLNYLYYNYSNSFYLYSCLLA